MGNGKRQDERGAGDGGNNGRREGLEGGRHGMEEEKGTGGEISPPRSILKVGAYESFIHSSYRDTLHDEWMNDSL